MGDIKEPWEYGERRCTFHVSTIRILHETSTAGSYLIFTSGYRLWRDGSTGYTHRPTNSHPNPNSNCQFNPRNRCNTLPYPALGCLWPVADTFVWFDQYRASRVDHGDPSAK